MKQGLQILMQNRGSPLVWDFSSVAGYQGQLILSWRQQSRTDFVQVPQAYSPCPHKQRQCPVTVETQFFLMKVLGSVNLNKISGPQESRLGPLISGQSKKVSNIVPPLHKRCQVLLIKTTENKFQTKPREIKENIAWMECGCVHWKASDLHLNCVHKSGGLWFSGNHPG